MINCNKWIYSGLKLRYIVTIITLPLLKYVDSGFIKKHILLILPILLTYLDHLDTTYTRSNNNYTCTKTPYYQINDKICDILSYLLVIFLFDIDALLNFFVFYRLLGVILYTITNNNMWLIIFFDLVKEYLIYMYLFGANKQYLPIVIIGKILFEYAFHRFHNIYSK